MREPQPTFVPPMLLTAGAVPDGETWSLEVKWDGCRVQLRYDGRAVTLRTRHGRECAEDFPELHGIADALGERRVILDVSWSACATTAARTSRGCAAVLPAAA